VQILLDNNKISNYSLIPEGMNTFGYESLNEVFFDVYEIKSNGLDLVKEKKGDFDGNPIIEFDIRVDNEIYKNVRFVLTKENKICINPNLLDHTKVVAYEKKAEKLKETPKLPVIKENEEVFVKQKNKVIQEDPVIKEESLIEKTKKEFFESIRGEVLEELKREIKAGIISDLIKENVQINFDSVVSDNGNKNKLQKILENYNNSFRKDYIELAEKVSRREAMRYTEGGGGTNAVQFANGGRMDGDLFVTGNFQSNSMAVGALNVDSLIVNKLSANTQFVFNDLTVAQGFTANNIYSNYIETLSSKVKDVLYVDNNAYVSGLLSANRITVDTTLNVDTLTANYGVINHDLTVYGDLCANRGYINTNLTVAGAVSSGSGHVLGDVLITGNLKVLNSIDGGSIIGSTIVGSNSLEKAVKNITGASFVNGDCTVVHNLSTYDLLLTLYSVNPDGKNEVVHASMINNSLSTTLISFAEQPDPSENYRLIIIK
jgi:hypothetical protein